MQTLTEQQREILRDSYTAGVLSIYERLSVSPSDTWPKASASPV